MSRLPQFFRRFKKEKEKLVLRVMFPGKGIRYVQCDKKSLDLERMQELSSSSFEDGYWSLNINVHIAGEMYNATQFPLPGHPDHISSALDLICNILDARIKLRNEKQQIADWVYEFGTPVQKQRFDHDLLAEMDITNAMNRHCFAPLDKLFLGIVISGNNKVKKAQPGNISDEQFVCYLEIQKQAKQIHHKAVAILSIVEKTAGNKNELAEQIPVIEVTIPNGSFDFIAWYFPKFKPVLIKKEKSAPDYQECPECAFHLEPLDTCEPCPNCGAGVDLITCPDDQINLEQFMPMSIVQKEEAVNELS